MCLVPRTIRQNINLSSQIKAYDIGAGYDTCADNLSSFRSVGNEPLPIDLNMLDEGDGISNTLTRNHAKWHASCRLKCVVSVA